MNTQKGMKTYKGYMYSGRLTDSKKEVFDFLDNLSRFMRRKGQTIEIRNCRVDIYNKNVIISPL